MAKRVKTSSAAPAAAAAPANRRQQQGLILGAVVVAVVIAVVAVIAINQGGAGDTVTIEENQGYAGIPIGGQNASARTVEQGPDVAEGVERGISEDGIPYIGSLEAPLVLAEFMDFTCPFCASYHPTMERIINDFVRTGEARVEIYLIPADNRAPYSTNAARAAVCADEQGAYWEMHDELLRITRAGSITDFTPEGVEDIATDLGLDGSAVRECMSTNISDPAIIQARRIAREYGVDSTPTVLYRLNTAERWNGLPDQDGSLGGGRPYETLAQIIRSANQQTGG
ncbi:MAG: thioredoxin domain-containing protein [Anaerolineae bacterium]|nr:thioredoxin domain-containing protein [Anaerolineae bacterium]